MLFLVKTCRHCGKEFECNEYCTLDLPLCICFACWKGKEEPDTDYSSRQFDLWCYGETAENFYVAIEMIK